MKQKSSAIGMRLCYCLLIVGMSSPAGRAMPPVLLSSSPALAAESTGLVVQIENVTDDQSSRRSSVDLFVDGRKISPNIAGTQGRRDFVFEIPLAPGVYEVKATYRAKSFWKEKSFKLQTHDSHVRVHPGHRTFLAITLDKKPDGTLRDKKNFFTETAQPLTSTTTQDVSAPQSRPGEPVGRMAQSRVFSSPSQPAPAVEHAQTIATSPAAPAPTPVMTIAPRASAAVPPAPARENTHAILAQPSAPQTEITQPDPNHSGKVALQINTSPSGADVIVDDRYVGQSPLTTYVERSRSHVIQISKTGYLEIMKIIDLRSAGNENAYLMLEKMEAQKEGQNH